MSIDYSSEDELLPVEVDVPEGDEEEEGEFADDE